MGNNLSHELLKASSSGHLDQVRCLLQSGKVDVNERDSSTGWTSLHWAAFRGHAFIISELASHKADVNATDIHRMTPLHWAALYGNDCAITELLEYQADANIKDNKDRIPLFVTLTALRSCLSITTIKMLISSTSDIDTPGPGGRTALHIAAKKGRADVAELLLRRGANMHELDKDRKSPAMLALSDDMKKVFTIWSQRCQSVSIDYSVNEQEKAPAPPSSQDASRRASPPRIAVPLPEMSYVLSQDQGEILQFASDERRAIQDEINTLPSSTTEENSKVDTHQEQPVLSESEHHIETETPTKKVQAEDRQVGLDISPPEEKQSLFRRLTSVLKRRPNSSTSSEGNRESLRSRASTEELVFEYEESTNETSNCTGGTYEGIGSGIAGQHATYTGLEAPQLSLSLNDRSGEDPSPVLLSPDVDSLSLRDRLHRVLSQPHHLQELSKSLDWSSEAVHDLLTKLAEGLQIEETQGPNNGVASSQTVTPKPGSSSQEDRETTQLAGEASPPVITQNQPSACQVNNTIQTGTIVPHREAEVSSVLAAVGEVSSCMKLMQNMAPAYESFQQMADKMQHMHQLLEAYMKAPLRPNIRPTPESGWRKQLQDNLDREYLPDCPKCTVKLWTDEQKYIELVNDKHVYPMTKRPGRGLAIIININNIRPWGNSTERKGSMVDVKLMDQLMGQLDFDREIYTDLQSCEIKEVLKDITMDESLETYQCFTLCLMAHGQHNCIIGSDGRGVHINDIIDCFTSSQCPGLAGKPKLFLLQYCRGVMRDTGSLVQFDGPEPVRIPDRVDMCVMHSTTEGYQSSRNTVRGSLFIQAVVKVFAEYAATDHLMELTTRVISEVSSQDRGGIMFGEQTYKQAPEVGPYSMGKRLYFFPGR